MTSMQEFFDEWAKNYDDYLPKLPQFRELTKMIVSHANVDLNSEVLDVGVGTGFLSFSLYEAKKCKIHGIDISPEMIEKAKAKSRELDIPIFIEQGNVMGIKETNIYDLAVASFVLHHIKDEKKHIAFKNIYNALKNNSRLILGEVTIDVGLDASDKERRANIVEKYSYAADNARKYAGEEFAKMELEYLEKVYKRDMEYIITPKEWCNLLEQSGFKNVQDITIDDKLGYHVFIGDVIR